MDKDTLYNAMLEYAKYWPHQYPRTHDEKYAYNDALLDIIDILGYGDDGDYWQKVNAIFEEL